MRGKIKKKSRISATDFARPVFGRAVACGPRNARCRIGFRSGLYNIGVAVVWEKKRIFLKKVNKLFASSDFVVTFASAFEKCTVLIQTSVRKNIEKKGRPLSRDARFSISREPRGTLRVARSDEARLKIESS